MAMAVHGKNRHYRVNDIVPRHFVYTAKQAGVGESTVNAIFEELQDTSVAALDATCAAMPKGFPEELSKAITEGFCARLRLLAMPVSA